MENIMDKIKIVSRPWQPQDLIDDLQEIIDEECDNYLNTRRTTLCMARDFLKEYFAEPKWIPVTERLPERDVKVLTFGVYGFSVNYRDRFSGKWRGVNGRSQWITHWMPLPEPPKENDYA